MGKPTLARRNRVRALTADPVGIEYLTRLNAAEVGQGVQASGTVSESNTPKIDNERGYTYPITVTNVPQLLLPADLNRTMFSLINNDVLGRVTVSFGAPRAFGLGFPANAGGGGFLLDNNVPTSAIYVVGDIASNVNVSYTVR